ncbi:hypothetical protein [Delftia sp. UGAL515B_04]|uniref:hypothetical protein n=1 Tax=Delftia sp. UGAL515B_04 TaxID=2986766 RepID=UPI0029532237|nr:hypothetical protein [Delftia sp. UGAL515B_04]WON88681.1 hypothetical protein OK021_28825 [Delftia sp. UGAL515B_04]
MSKTQLNCKPGDRAVVEGTNTEGDGRTLTVLHRAPQKRFRLPDGQWNIGAGTDVPKWVVQLDKPAQAPLGIGGAIFWQRAATYGVVRDSALRPISTPEAA